MANSWSSENIVFLEYYIFILLSKWERVKNALTILFTSWYSISFSFLSETSYDPFFVFAFEIFEKNHGFLAVEWCCLIEQESLMLLFA